MILEAHKTMPKVAPQVFIIVLNWNNYQDIKECLDSLRKITYPNHEIIVVDNGSIDNSGEKLEQEFPQYTFIRNDSNLGFAEGNNVGIRYALKRGADYVLLLNNDTVVDPGFLESLVGIAETDGQIGVVGPIIYFYDKPQVIQSIGARMNFWKGSHPIIGIREVDRGQYDKPMEVDYVSGAALLVKRRVIEDIGLLDADYFLYGEEVDWCYRAAKAGYKIVAVPESKIWHKVSSSTGGTKSPLFAYYLTRNRILFMRKHARIYHWVTFLLFFTMDILKGLLSCAKHGDINRAKATLKGLLHGILGIYGKNFEWAAIANTGPSVLVLVDFSYLDPFSAKGIRAKREIEMLKNLGAIIEIHAFTGRQERREEGDLDEQIHIHNVFSAKLTWLLAPLLALKMAGRAYHFDKLFAIESFAGWVGTFLSYLSRKPLVLDCHGATPEECIYSGRRYFKCKILAVMEWIIFRRASQILAVSEGLKTHLSQARGVNNDKIWVLPNCVEDWYSASAQMVRARRLKTRTELELKEKIVFVYCGSALKWQKVPEMIKLYANVKKAGIMDGHFLIITNEKDKFRDMLREEGLLGEATILKANHHDIPSLLPAGDIGLLLRDNNIVNKVAAPTKAAEYLACGVPILATYGIGNVQGLLEVNGAGIEITLDLERELPKILAFVHNVVSQRDKYMRNAIGLANSHFRWGAYENVFRSMLEC